MRAPLSIVIPTLNAEAELAATLPPLMEGLDAGLVRELIVSDGGSTDATQKLAEAVGAEWIRGAPGRGGQLRRGADAAQGQWLLFLHADSHLADGWSEAVSAHMAKHHGVAGYFWLRFRASGMMPWIVSRWANLRSRRLGLPYGDQALLVDCKTYDSAGGFDDIPLMEDVAMARKLRQLRPLGLCIATSADRYEQAGWLRRGTRNLITLLRYFSGADPQALAQAYRKR